ncbi:MAG: aldo/keto reductase [Oscillospiraceae bacterium]
MNYRKLKNTGENVSILGLGCMRFPLKNINGKDVVDETESIKMIRHAIDNGVKYIDTAFIYHAGESETIVGKALRDGYREKVMLATKSFTPEIKSADDFDKMLDKQLEKLQTNTIDFYLQHCLSLNLWKEKVEKFGLLEKLKKAKSDGKIRHIGFSFHDDLDTFKMIVDSFDEWEFFQIQLNYADIAFQSGIEGLEYASKKGLDIIVMEPLRGGDLAMPTVNVVDSLNDTKSLVEWGLDFVWNRPEVGVVLSGMSNLNQLNQNIEFASRATANMLSSSECEMLENAGKIFNSQVLAACTKCEYCMPCPMGIVIPDVMKAYNMTTYAPENSKKLFKNMSVQPSACISCKKCENACPQHLKISEIMNLQR